MSDRAQGPEWWQASDGRWYAPELHPSRNLPPIPPPPGPPVTPTVPSAVLPPIPPPSKAPVPPPVAPSASPPIAPPGGAPPVEPLPGSPEPPRRDHLKWVLAAAVVLLLAVTAVIVYLVQRDDDRSITAGSPVPAPSASTQASTTTSPAGAGSTTEDASGSTTLPDGTTPAGDPAGPSDPADPSGLPTPDPAASAALLRAIGAGGPERAADYANEAIDNTLIQFGQAICLTSTELRGTGGDAASVIPTQLEATRDQLAESSAAIWADPSRAAEGYGRVIYYGIKYLCPDNLSFADAAFPDLAGS